MKKIILPFFIFFSLHAQSQIKALTEDGKEVVLLDDKTWKFVNESDAKTLETITTNEQSFEKTKESTFLVKSKNVDGGFYYNPKSWKIAKIPNNVNPFMEYGFTNVSNSSLFGLFGSEIMPVQSLKNLKDIIISTIQRKADYFRLKTSEYRTINGIKVLHLEYNVNLKGLDFEYIANLYLTPEGYCSITAYTYGNLFEANKEKMESFTNGIVKAEKASEVVEVAPPPPMSTVKSK